MTDSKEELDPLIEALPPATDYLTYLTLVEYQLTPARLPILHRVLQDETLTVNIGWDLVNMLLPLLPQSQECLDDIAKLGNPREVILRVSEALMKLHTLENLEEDAADEEHDIVEGHEESSTPRRLPLRIQQFNCLLSMLSTLHSRIKTKYPSRFVATSLQAVLEAYSEYPSVETTAALLELLRDLSVKKRPRLPPRDASERTVTQSTGDMVPDPEADANSGEDSVNSVNEGQLSQRLLQFGLIETLKTYLLQCVDEPVPSGMLWAVRILEKLDPTPSLVTTHTDKFKNTDDIKERDTTLSKIVALSRDFGLEIQDLQRIVSKGENDHPPPLDFENIPSRPDGIILERHGCLLLLAARYTTGIIFGSGVPEKGLLLYPDIVNILLNFLGDFASPYTAAAGEPISLIDSILSLAATAEINTAEQTVDEEGFKTLVYGLTACIRGPTQFRAFSRLEAIPARAFHAYPDIQVRYNLLLEIFSDIESNYARLSALKWLKGELISYSTTPANAEDGNPFSDPESFTILFQSIYKFTHPGLSLPSSKDTEDITPGVWMIFLQELAPLYLAKLNLYYFLCVSEKLVEQLPVADLKLTYDSKFWDPLSRFIDSLSKPSVTSWVEKELGDAALQTGRNTANMILHINSNIEAMFI